MQRKRKVIAGIVAVVAIVILIGWALPNRLWMGVTKLPHLHGQTIEAVVSKFGSPSHTSEFPMSSCCPGEFDIELLNFYPPQDPKSANVRIRTYIWDYKNYHVAVWFHLQNGKWVALDSCQWPEGVEF